MVPMRGEGVVLEEPISPDFLRTKFLLVKRRLQRQLEAVERRAAAEEEQKLVVKRGNLVNITSQSTNQVKNL